MKKSLLPLFKKTFPALQLITFLFLFTGNINAQVTADFIADVYEGCSPLTVHFTNQSTGSNLMYDWKFGSAGISTDEDPVKEFENSGIYAVRLITTNASTMEDDTVTKNIRVILTPSADLIIDTANACANGNVLFVIYPAQKDSVSWDFGDGYLSDSMPFQIMPHAYDSDGTYNGTFITYFSDHVCSDTFDFSVNVNGPTADFTVTPEEECANEQITFTLGTTSGVDSYYWDVGEGGFLYGSTVYHSYDTMGYIVTKLHLSGPLGTCMIDDTIHIYEVIADFNYPEDQLCNGQNIYFNNISVGNANNFWDLDNGITSESFEPVRNYTTGSYNISLKVTNEHGCADSTEQMIEINDIPSISLGGDVSTCSGSPVMISVSGGDIASWTPVDFLNDPNSFTPDASPTTDILYSATITDTVTHCSNSGELNVIVQEELSAGDFSVVPASGSLVIGDTLTLNVIDEQNRILHYNWISSPLDEQMNCTDCPDPVILPLQNTTYTVEISDTNGCFPPVSINIPVEVEIDYKIGVPAAFTPNKDGINEFIHVHGRGIKTLIEFKIYNRWGDEVFSTNDINEGWDGTKNGNPLSMDTYAYVVKAEMWDNNIVTKKGTFSLIR